MGGLPSDRRVQAAARIVDFFKDANPELYKMMGSLDFLSDEMKVDCIEKVKAAALAAYSHHREMVRKQGGKVEEE